MGPTGPKEITLEEAQRKNAGRAESVRASMGEALNLGRPATDAEIAEAAEHSRQRHASWLEAVFASRWFRPRQWSLPYEKRPLSSAEVEYRRRGADITNAPRKLARTAALDETLRIATERLQRPLPGGFVIWSRALLADEVLANWTGPMVPTADGIGRYLGQLRREGRITW